MNSSKKLIPVDQIPAGEWVILSADQSRVVAHDLDLGKAMATAQELGEKHGVIMKAEAVGHALVG